jgi:hypothetical protein
MLVLARVADRKVGHQLFESTREVEQNALAYLRLDDEKLYEQKRWSATTRYKPQKRTTLFLIKRVDNLT